MIPGLHLWLLFALMGVVCWAAVNVIDSLIVRHFPRHPVTLMWHQSWFSVATLLIVGLVLGFPSSSWLPLLLLSGAFAYIGDIIFFIALDRMDVSITNLSWAILSVFLSICGFFLFAERWTIVQGIGAICVLGGIIVLSLWQRHAFSLSSFVLLLTIAFAYVPFYLAQKGSLEAGEEILAVFFWPMIARECIAFFFPWFSRSYRRGIWSSFHATSPLFLVLNASVIAAFFAGIFLVELAYSVGPVSLVAIIANIQPFIVILLATLAAVLLPRLAPRELLTSHSLRAKLVSFSLVFIGLAFLAAGQ